MLGDFDFPAFQAAEKHFGPMFFIFYIFIVFFILLNMFLAIINDTYSEIKGEMEATKIQFEITDLFARGYNNVLGIKSSKVTLKSDSFIIKRFCVDERQND